MDALNPTLSEYADRALPRIFSETEAFLEIVERKLAAGKYLHAEDIAKLQKTYREEWGDADLLWRFVRARKSLLFGTEIEKGHTANAISQNVHDLVDACAERMSEVLVRTSIGAVFFNASIAYVEEYESRHGFSKKPGMEIKVVYQLIGEDFERAKQVFADFEFHVADSLAPIQGKIAHCQSTGETTELSKLVSERELLARELRKASKQLDDTRNSDFAILAKRLALHDITVSQVWG